MSVSKHAKQNLIYFLYISYILVYPKSVRPSSTNSCSSSNATKHRVRCSLCDALLKASSTHRYLLSGKSVHDSLEQGVTYGECCQRYLSESCDLNKLHMICPKCCQNLQRIHSLYKDAEQLKQSIQHTWCKTKRLNRARHSRVNYSRMQDDISSSSLPTIAIDTDMIISVKEEPNTEDLSVIMKQSLEKIPIRVSKSIMANIPHDLSNKTQQHTHQNELSTKIPQTVDRNQSYINEIPSVCLIFLDSIEHSTHVSGVEESIAIIIKEVSCSQSLSTISICTSISIKVIEWTRVLFKLITSANKQQSSLCMFPTIKQDTLTHSITSSPHTLN